MNYVAGQAIHGSLGGGCGRVCNKIQTKTYERASVLIELLVIRQGFKYHWTITVLEIYPPLFRRWVLLLAKILLSRCEPEPPSNLTRQLKAALKLCSFLLISSWLCGTRYSFSTAVSPRLISTHLFLLLMQIMSLTMHRKRR